MPPAVYVSTGPLGLTPAGASEVLAQDGVTAIEFSGGTFTPDAATVVKAQAERGLTVQVLLPTPAGSIRLQPV